MTQIERKHFAAGDYLTRYPAGNTYDLRIDSLFEKPGWKARTFSPGGTIFPGSAIEFEGTFYEILFQEYLSGNPLMISYCLKKWEDHFPIRLPFHYNEQECRNMALSYRSRLKSNQTRSLLVLFSPVAGMLPAEDQIKIANRYGMQATQMTFVSSLLMLFPAGFLIVFCISYWFWRAPLPGPASIHWIYPAGFYFFAESLLRMLSAAKLDEPTGSILLSAPILIWRFLLRLVHRPRPAQDKIDSCFSAPPSAPANQPDQVREIDAESIEIISALPKPHWNIRVGIGWNSAWYGLLNSDKIRVDGHTYHRYQLKKAPEGTWFASVVEYSPDEVQILLKDKRRRELKTWVDTFSFFWGLLSREDQLRLELQYDFDALKFTKISIVAIAILSASNLGVSAINIIADVESALDVWLLPVCGYLLLECYSRWRDLKLGEPSGSILGFVVRPFAGKLLQGP